MTFYSEKDCIAAIEKNWGEIESYEWNGGHELPEYRFVKVTFTPDATNKIVERCNRSPIRRIAPKPLVAGDISPMTLNIRDIALLLGHAAFDCPDGDCPEVACFVEGGIAVFADHDEYATWRNQK